MMKTNFLPISKFNEWGYSFDLCLGLYYLAYFSPIFCGLSPDMNFQICSSSENERRKESKEVLSTSQFFLSLEKQNGNKFSTISKYLGYEEIFLFEIV